ncbi:MAG: VTT domain-containing protein [Patescibacteria group bacterium]|nr:VTT domain-containing protein [Patescibacteria group bacterium]
MKNKEIIVVVVILILFLLAGYFAREYSEALKGLIQFQGPSGMLLYVLGAIVATVIAPLSFLPFLPVAVALWGSFIAAVLSIIAWTAGAIIAFTLARRYGHPLVHKIVNMKKIERFENLIPPQNLFWSVVFMRVALPVDLLSYALGLFTEMRFGPYVLATVIGITPFAFVFSYLVVIPSAFQIIALVIGLIVIFLGYRHVKKKY